MRPKIILITILFFGLILRLYRLDNPIGDWHAFRQADTSAVSKIFVYEGFNLLVPKYFDISNIQSGLDNPQGYRMVEFPIFNTLQAGGYKFVGLFSLEEWGRIITIFSSLLSVLFIYLLVKKYIDLPTAFFSSLFFAVLPFSVYYGRVILPDPSASMAILGGIYFFDRWTSEKSSKFLPPKFQFLLGVLFTASAFLIKPFTLFFVFPFLYISWIKFKFDIFKNFNLYLFGVLSILPLVFWRVWITQFPEGIPASNWLFNEGNIRFSGAQFFWIFGDRIGKLILGYTGYLFLLLGFLKRNERYFGFSFSFAISSLLYLIIIARGNVQHDYYQIFILPTICIFLGRGLSNIFYFSQSILKSSLYNSSVVIGVIGFAIFAMIFLSWYHVRDFFNINNKNLVIAGEKADEILPKNARVIAANNGDTSFLYYANRRGWPAYQKSPDELSKMGATHIIIPSPTKEDEEGLGKTYKRVYSSPEVLILEISR